MLPTIASVLLVLSLSGPAMSQTPSLAAPDGLQETLQAETARLRALVDQLSDQLARRPEPTSALNPAPSSDRAALIDRVRDNVGWFGLVIPAALGLAVIIVIAWVRRTVLVGRKETERAAEWAAQSWLKSYAPDEVEKVLALKAGKEIERIRWYAEDAVEKLKRHGSDVRERAEQARQSGAEARAITHLVAAAATVAGEVSASAPDPETMASIRAAASKAGTVPTTERGIGDWLALGADALVAGRTAGAGEAFGRALRIADGTALQYARAAAGVGHAKVLAGDGDDAIRAFERADAHVRDLGGEEERLIAAGSLFNLAIALRRQGRREEALAAFETLVGRFFEDSALPIRSIVAIGMVGKGVMVAETHGPAAAIAVYDDVIRQFGDDPTFAESIADALVNKGIDLAEVNGPAAAMEVYDEVVSRFGENVAPTLHEHVARALLNKGVGAADVQGPAAAIAIFDEVIRRCMDDPAPALREILARAMVNKGLMSALIDGSGAAIAIYDEVIRRFEEDQTSEIREQVANAFVNKGVMAAKALGPAAAIAVCDEMVHRFGRDPSPALREQVAKALFNKGASTARVEGQAAATAVYEELIIRFSGDPWPRVQEIVGAARGARDHIRGGHGTALAA
jgi:tetratricopeptide (TPR) repeat protein